MITNRQLDILNAIVEDHVDLGQPIGSKTLIDRHNLNVGPATTRNEMKYLRELNFLEKVHPSSGCTPPGQGFRLYVNQLLKQTSHQKQNKVQRLNQLLIENHYDIPLALSHFADGLSIKPQYVALVVRPNHKIDIMNNVHLIRANSPITIMVIIYNSGHVEHLHLSESMEFGDDRLIRTSNFLTDNYYKSQLDFNKKLKQFTNSIAEQSFINESTIMLISHLHKQSNNIFMGGKVKLIDTLNETNVSSIQPTLQYLEPEKIIELLENTSTSETNVKIGHEIDKGLNDTSIIASQYHFDDALKGQIVVIGPAVVHYQNVIQLLNQIW